MAHTIRGKKRLLNRVRRIAGQVEALTRALEEERECAETLRLIASARGAMNGLMAEVLEGHLCAHAFGRAAPSKGAEAAEQVIDVVWAYLR